MKSKKVREVNGHWAGEERKGRWIGDYVRETRGEKGGREEPRKKGKRVRTVMETRQGRRGSWLDG